MTRVYNGASAETIAEVIRDMFVNKDLIQRQDYLEAMQEVVFAAQTFAAMELQGARIAIAAVNGEQVDTDAAAIVLSHMVEAKACLFQKCRVFDQVVASFQKKE